MAFIEQNHSTLPSFQVALVCMPFYGADRPSIQLGLLKAIAAQHGFLVDTYYFNLDLAAMITLNAYEQICELRKPLTGEWLFSIAAFEDDIITNDEVYFDIFPDELARLISILGKDKKYISRLRHEILPSFIEGIFQSVDWSKYAVIGFTSTFQQNASSFALAKRIKTKHPSIRIVFGGANFDDEMGREYLRAFPFIDYAVIGEGDIAFPALLNALASVNHSIRIPGVLSRGGEVVDVAIGCKQIDLNELPTPNYDDYFEHAHKLNLLNEPNYPPYIPFEGSRGCWWGEKSQCTFCGFNNRRITYRSKKPEKLLYELSYLSQKYRGNVFASTDTILDPNYLDTFFKYISRNKIKFNFYYEVKANLNREQVGTLYDGGVRVIQPGIESLSTRILNLMHKGTTMLQNVRLLKWARYYDMSVAWNLLWGFPGESEEDYREELRAVRLISHLEPPLKCVRIRLDRFSPYHTSKNNFPIHDIRPEKSYSLIYPSYVKLEKIAYFFDYEMDDTLPFNHEVHQATAGQLKDWSISWHSKSPDSLSYKRTSDGILIEDNRKSTLRETYVFDDARALIYEFCDDSLPTAADVSRRLNKSDHNSLDEICVEEALNEFCQRGLMLSDNGRYLSLALPI